MRKGPDSQQLFSFYRKGMKKQNIAFCLIKEVSLIQRNKGTAINKTSFLHVEYIMYNLYFIYNL